MSKKSFLPMRRAKLSYFPLDTIVDELLYAILQHVFQNDKQDLLSLCLVSRRFYFPIVGILYREIYLDLTAASHKQTLLFRQLTHPDSRIPERIRILYGIRGARLEEEHCVGLHTLFRKMKHLESLIWIGPLHISQDSEEFLDLFHLRFPQTQLLVRDEDVLDSYGSPKQVEHAMDRLLNRSVRSQITLLALNFKNPNDLNTNFKRDLIGMMKCNQALASLRLAVPAGVSFPEYPAALSTGDLPRLQHLDLGKETSIFTQSELTGWGDTGGWSKLTTVMLGSLECLPSFVGRALILTYLHLFLHDQEDTDDIYHALGSAGTVLPFPRLQRLGCNMRGLMTQLNLRFMDVKVLKWMPNITKLQVVREFNTFDASALAQGLPTAQHIKEIRHFCPGLEALRLEICLVGRYWKWPLDIIDELSRFPKLSTLHLIVTCESDTQGRPRMSKSNHWMLGRRIRRERQRLGLPWTSPFRIEISSFQAGQWLNLFDESTFTILSRKRRLGAFTTLYSHRKHFHRPTNLDGSSMEDLESMKLLRIKGMPVWKWRQVVQEIERRERSENRVMEMNELPTLYDMWMEQHDQVHFESIQAA